MLQQSFLASENLGTLRYTCFYLTIDGKKENIPNSIDNNKIGVLICP